MTSCYHALVALCLAVALGPLLAIGAILHGGAQNFHGTGRPGEPQLSSPAVTYFRDVNAALERYDAARREGDRLLTERDADPRLADSGEWRQNFGRVAEEHQRVYALMLGLHPPPGADAVQKCLVDGFRLTATGEGLLSEAFGADGHHAYYLGAHGNWDLNLGDRAVARCRGSLASIEAKA